MFEQFGNLRSSDKYARHRRITWRLQYLAIGACVGWMCAHFAVTLSPNGTWPHDLFMQTIIDSAASFGGVAGLAGFLLGAYKIWVNKK